MTKKECIQMAKNMKRAMTGFGSENGSGYWRLTYTEIKNDNGDVVSLESVVELCKFAEETTSHSYYGIYSLEHTYATDICEGEWDYTNDLRIDQVADILYKLANKVFTPDAMKKMYLEDREKKTPHQQMIENPVEGDTYVFQREEEALAFCSLVRSQNMDLRISVEPVAKPD